VAIPYGITDLFPIRALCSQQYAARIPEEAVFRRLWARRAAGTAALPLCPASAPRARGLDARLRRRAQPQARPAEHRHGDTASIRLASNSSAATKATPFSMALGNSATRSKAAPIAEFSAAASGAAQ
jgi:hypothetical protein